MKLSITPLGQRNPLWSSKKLGKSTSLTIGSDGCLLVCHSMMLGYFGHQQTPDLLNEIYKSKKVFDNALINFYAAGNVFEDIKAVEYYNCENVPCDLGKLDKYLFNKQPVIAWVDNVLGDGKPDHFVLIVGKTEDGHYIINDPWMGEEYFFDAKYGEPSKAIYGLRIYDGPKNTTSLEDKISDLENKVQSLNKTVAELALENNNLRFELSSQEKENDELSKQISEARSKVDTLSWEKTELDNKNKYLQEALDVAKTTETTLKTQLVKLEQQNISAISPIRLILLGVKKLFERG